MEASMSTPTLKSSNLEQTDPSEAKPQPTLTSEISQPQTDQVVAEDNGQQDVADADPVRVAEARINHAAAVIRSLSDSRPQDCGQHSWPHMQSNTSRPPEENVFTETRPRFLSSLDPEIVPDPPKSERRLNLGPALFRFSLMAILAAILAYGITMVPSSQRGILSSKGATDGVASVGPHGAASEGPWLSRLVLDDQRAFTNEPLALGISIAPAIGFGSILVGGLTPGTRLSAGTALTSVSWELPLDKLGGVYVYAPQNFIGVMNAVIDLLAPTKRIIDSRAERLEWMPKVDSLQRGKEIDSEGAGGAVAKRIEKPIDPHDAIVLLERGRELLNNGDIALAQLAFRRLADAGIADAALALANTYDPHFLAKHNLIDIIGDESKARLWYRRASELGSAEADHILARTDSK
jgi:hypothetical protein